MSTHCDLTAIGGGNGGLTAAEQAARHGKRVAIVEPTELGGSCVNAGCVPKKVMWYAAQLARAVDDVSALGSEELVTLRTPKEDPALNPSFKESTAWKEPS